jgi:hypothetical protein
MRNTSVGYQRHCKCGAGVLSGVLLAGRKDDVAAFERINMRVDGNFMVASDNNYDII